MEPEETPKPDDRKSGARDAGTSDGRAGLEPIEAPAGGFRNLLDKENIEKNFIAMLDKATENGKKKVDHIAFTAGDSLNLPKLGELDLATAMDQFTVRFFAPCALAKVIHNGDYMHKSSSSSITVTGGTNTHRPTPNFYLPAAVGAALEGLVRGLAVDMAPIRVNVVHPGAIHTELLEKFLGNAPPEAMEAMKKTNSLTGELGRPEDIAEAYGWIMRDRFANGTQVSSDGGRLLVSPQ